MLKIRTRGLNNGFWTRANFLADRVTSTMGLLTKLKGVVGGADAEREVYRCETCGTEYRAPVQQCEACGGDEIVRVDAE
jgi:rRNA maturation endonuclease Nob1